MAKGHETKLTVEEDKQAMSEFATEMSKLGGIANDILTKKYSDLPQKAKNELLTRYKASLSTPAEAKHREPIRSDEKPSSHYTSILSSAISANAQPKLGSEHFLTMEVPDQENQSPIISGINTPSDILFSLSSGSSTPTPVQKGESKDTEITSHASKINQPGGRYRKKAIENAGGHNLFRK